MRSTLPFLIPVFALLLGSCQQRDAKPLFRSLDAQHTGITFANTLAPDSLWNIIRFRYYYNGGGVAIGDLNGDGLPDLFFTGNQVSNRLYLNKGGLKFEDITAKAGLTTTVWSTGVAMADVNGDGLTDLYVCVSGDPDPKRRENLLFIHQGNDAQGYPQFAEQAAAYGLNDPGYTTQAAFFDFDRDGDLDVYLLTAANTGFYGMDIRRPVTDGEAPTTDKLYRNNGDGSFTDVSRAAGITIEGFGLGIAVSDVNRDGWPDIYVANDYLSSDHLYINRGDSAGVHLGFTEQAARYFQHQSHFSMGMDIGDVNNDGLADIVTLDMLPEHHEGKMMMAGAMNYDRFQLALDRGYMPQYMRNMLQLNQGFDRDGRLHFSEVGQLAGIHQTDWSWSALLADFDNDGNRDLHISNGYVKDITNMDFVAYDMNQAMQVFNPRAREATIIGIYDALPPLDRVNYLYRNEGNLRFRALVPAWGSSFSNGAAYGDLDLDGDLDLVVSNINAPAFVLQNLTRENQPASTNYLMIRMQGPPKNRSGIGCRITLNTGSGIQVQEQYLYRGYQSTVDEVMHFGLGTDTLVDRLEVVWPDGKWQRWKNLSVNQTLLLRHDAARPGPASTDSVPDLTAGSAPRFEEVTVASGLSYRHRENDYVDFNTQPLLLQQYSRYGPGIAVGDVDANGWDDVYIGGALGQSGRLFLQAADGTFAPVTIPGEDHEDLGALFFDADQDQDLDLYLVSGGTAHASGHAAYQDRLLLNDGNGNFSPAPDALPDMRSSGSCVIAADFDQDGDLDLFVGGRVVPGAYPLSPRSYLLLNEGGKFEDATDRLCPALQQLGMVSAALWSDYNNDGWIDLIVVGEGMPITLWENRQGKSFHRHGHPSIDQSSGWWNSLTGADFDNDGDTDYLVGNLGWNTRYQVSEKHPMITYAKDFDHNGSVDAVTFYYQKDRFGQYQLFPAHSRDVLAKQIVSIKRMFPRYQSFAEASLENFFSAQDLSDAFHINYTQAASVYLENLGEGNFQMKSLPIPAQFAPVFGMQCFDADGDVFQDVMLVGNYYTSRVETGRYDALGGLYLSGTADGPFQVRSATQTGLYIRGDAKALARIHSPQGDQLLITRNDDMASLLTLKQDHAATTIRLNANDAWLEIYFKDGSKRKVECYYGSGYLSQSSRVITLPKEVNKIEIFDFQGTRRSVNVKSAL